MIFTIILMFITIKIIIINNLKKITNLGRLEIAMKGRFLLSIGDARIVRCMVGLS